MTRHTWSESSVRCLVILSPSKAPTRKSQERQLRDLLKETRPDLGYVLVLQTHGALPTTTLHSHCWIRHSRTPHPLESILRYCTMIPVLRREKEHERHWKTMTATTTTTTTSRQSEQFPIVFGEIRSGINQVLILKQ